MTNHKKLIEEIMAMKARIERKKLEYAKKHEERMSQLSDDDLKSFQYLINLLDYD